MTTRLTHITVAKVVAAVRARGEPLTHSEILTEIGAEWEERGTVRNRVNEATEIGLLVCDENRPARVWTPGQLHETDGA